MSKPRFLILKARNRPNPAFCNAGYDGWYCVLAKLHVENHEVRDPDTDKLLAAWTQDGKMVPV